jgi:hypothetical protein
VVLKLVGLAVEDVLVMMPVEFAVGVEEVLVKVLVLLETDVVRLLSLSVEFQA